MIPQDYFAIPRREIAPLLPTRADRILDVGCGAGSTSAWLKTLYPSAHFIGLEGNADLLSRLEHNVNEAFIVDLNSGIPDVGHPDLILLLDILEHLIDPDRLLANIVKNITDGATVIISIPNIAYIGVSARLFLFGRFDYQDAGILDRTHLRFFYKDSIKALVERNGLEIVSWLRNGRRPGVRPSQRLANWLTVGLLRNRLFEQHIFAARKHRDISSPSSHRPSAGR